MGRADCLAGNCRNLGFAVALTRLLPSRRGTQRRGAGRIGGMRYRLRTLLIVLALGPPLIAAGWWGYGKWREWQVRRAIERWGPPGFPPALVIDPEA